MLRSEPTQIEKLEHGGEQSQLMLIPAPTTCMLINSWHDLNLIKRYPASLVQVSLSPIMETHSS